MAFELMLYMAGLAIPYGWEVGPLHDDNFLHDGIVCLMRAAA
jgi:hypothetical protein